MSINPSTTPGYAPPPPSQPAPSAPPPSYSYAAVPPPAEKSIKIPLLFGAVVALLGSNIYLFTQVNKVKTDLGANQNTVMAELDKIRESSAITHETDKRNVESLRGALEVARRQASAAAGEARVTALKKVEETRVELEAAQEKASQQANQKISEVKQSADTANTKIGEVNTEVGTVKTDLTSTKSQLEKTVAELKRTTGDVDGHSTLIATNAKELGALRALGERNYVEFNIHKAKQPQRVGDIMVLLKSTNPKKNRFTIELTADDKTVEKKDKTLNEPLQFLTSKAKQPYEIVVNNVGKDQIAGYLAIPKVLAGRN
jgi:chromosome segregation ATPase